MNTQSTQRFVSNAAPHYHSALRRAAYRFSAQLNDLLVTTSPCRNSTLLDLPHRFATSLNSTQRFVNDAASLRFAPQQLAPLLNSTQRFVSDAAPQRLAPRRNASLRHALQRNNLLVTTSPQLCTPCRITPHHLAFHRSSTQRFVNDAAPLRRSVLRCTTFRNAPQRNDLLVTRLRSATIRSASPRNATQRFVSNVAPFRSASPRSATQRTSSQLNDLLVTPHRVALQHRTSLLASSQLNDLLVTLLRFSLPRTALLHYASRLNSTQRFVSDNDIASPLSAARRSAMHCIAALLNSTLSLNKGVQSCISDPLLH